jgi:pyrroline-5-carboxylate reductase
MVRDDPDPAGPHPPESDPPESDPPESDPPESDRFGLAIVGGGNMGAALAGGLLESGSFDPSAVAIVEVVAARRDELRGRFPGVAIEASTPPCRGAVLAVKPPDVPGAAAAAAAAGATRLLSIAAGVRLATIEAAAGGDVAVVRAMPNTPALVRHGVSAIAAGARADADDLEWARAILSAVGIVEELPEELLDAFTGVAGSGPAYVYLVAEALIEAAVEEGIDRPTAERVVAQLLLGASTLLDREGDPAALRVMVTSPGGTTEAGLRALDDRSVRVAFGAAVRAATARSRELG